MNLLLHESVLLLGLDDEKGHFHSTLAYLNYGFAAAILMDLILAERIVLEDKKLKVATNALTTNKILNEELERLYKAKKPPKVTAWLHNMVQRNSKVFKKCIDGLIQQGILKMVKKKVLWIFPVKRYPSLNLEPEHTLRRRLQNILFKGETPSRDDRMLLAIIEACQLVSEIVPEKEQRKQAKERIKKLTSESEMKKLLGDAIQEMQVVVMTATSGAV
jgi:Golgi phosphoprotein 3